MHRFLGVCAALLTTAVAAAQSMNIDINRNGNLTPLWSYGAAAGQIGMWNNVIAAASGSVSLVGLDGVTNGCSIARAGHSAANTPIGSGEFNALMGDYDLISLPSSQSEYTITGLSPGIYRIYMYMSLPPASAKYFDGGVEYSYNLASTVLLNNATVANASTSGPITPGTWEEGRTHAAITCNIPSTGMSLKIRTYTNGSANERAALNGIQIVKYTATRLYVDRNATGQNTGLSWADAFKDLQTALGLANGAPSQFQEIWVADGVYTPGSNRNATFTIPSGVKVLGGFAGGEVSPSQRDWTVNRTFLNGNIGDPIDQLDNVYHVVTASGTSPATRLDGFEIINGRANGSAPNDRGAGMYIADHGYLSVRNCKFGGNHCSFEGGAVWIGGTSLPDFVFCDFDTNSAGSFGGAIRLTGNSQLWVFNSTLRRNWAGSNGGAINSTAGHTRLVNCLFTKNTSQSGSGGAVQFFGANVEGEMRNCTLYGNTAAFAGGMSVQSGADYFVTGSSYYNNTDTSGNPLERQQIRTTSNGTVTVSCSLVHGWTAAGIGGTGNFTGNPLFMNPLGPDGQLGTTDDDFRLQMNSPCLDYASSLLLPRDTADTDGDGDTNEMTPWDRAGNPRAVDLPGVFNTFQSPVDLGAFETQLLLRGDMNCDGAVNNFDIDPFVMALTDPAAYQALYPNCTPINGDCNNDGSFNNFDIDPFVVCLTNFGCP
ncbi:MAG: hypothetical protein HRU75_00700 [Planctomycetia bacterium]|nr:MAG: hypothetical protein HRU75_00700 [Planctomycetia bacterium]